MLIMIVEDDETTVEFVSRALAQEGRHFVSFSDVIEASIFLKDHEPDMLILDQRLALRGQGTALAGIARSHYPACTICMFSAYDTFDTVRKAFRADVDDYILKREATRPEELGRQVEEAFARRRARVAAVRRPRVTADNLSMDAQTRTVTWYGTRISLTPSEYAILQQLTSEPGRVFSFSELCLASPGERGNPRIKVKSHIHNLRRKLEANHRPRTIWNSHSIGFEWKTPTEAMQHQVEQDKRTRRNRQTDENAPGTEA